MKKLMFIAAVVVAGLAQAASVDWSIAKKAFTMGDGSKPNGATVYIFDTAADGYTEFITALSGGTLGDTIKAETFTGAKGYLGSGTTYSSSNSTLLNNNYAKANGTVTVAKEGETYNLAAIVFDSSSGQYLVSGNAPGVSYKDNPDDGSVSAFAAANMPSSSWATYTPTGGTDPLPEPTSGLLLLVGGAVLALRRKQK